MRRRALILAGGKGTRSQNPLKPKILQEISIERRLLDIHLDQLEKIEGISCTFLLGHLSEIVIDELKKVKDNYSMAIDWVIDKPSDSILTSLLRVFIEEPNQDTLFTVVLGDVLVNLNYSRYFNRLNESDYFGSILVHPNLHPNDSDVFEFNGSNGPLNILQKKVISSGNFPTRSIAGVYFFKKSAINFVDRAGKEIFDGIIEPLYNLKKIDVINTLEYLQDTGTKSRLQKASQDYENGAFDRRGSSNKSCIFLDRDGTLIPNRGDNRKIIEPKELSLDIVQMISRANLEGIPIILVTNQPGIAKGFISEMDFLKTQYQLESYLMNGNAILDDFVFCPHHPEVGFFGEVSRLKIECECRKPKIGMLSEIVKRHEVNLKSSVMIGDTDRDQDLALASGMEFMKVTLGTDNRLNTSQLIEQAIMKILK